jgi:hypothetical protein
LINGFHAVLRRIDESPSVFGWRLEGSGLVNGSGFLVNEGHDREFDVPSVQIVGNFRTKDFVILPAGFNHNVVFPEIVKTQTSFVIVQPNLEIREKWQ